MVRTLQFSNDRRVRSTKRNEALPIGRAARIAYEIDTLRSDCCAAAQTLLAKESFDELELEECAQLDEGLAKAQRLLKATVRNVMISRLSRRSRTR
jgi:hypothetical protein